MEIPKYVKEIIFKLKEAGFEAYIVGGCVRDFFLGREIKDWDITTNARPDSILKIFPDAKYENIFGTVLVLLKNKNNKTEFTAEVTTYRSEQGYSNRRHPDKIKFEDCLDKDLERRDFTINAMALNIEKGKNIDKKIELIDLFGGKNDLEKRIIRTVGEPTERFREDALRMMRAIRFFCQLNFKIEEKTERAIIKMAGGIKFISNERIRDELIKIFQSDRAYEGILKLHKLKLLQYILPELERGIGVSQSKHHIYNVFTHSLLSLKYCPSKDWRIRFAALLHDIAKPQTKKITGNEATFYNHDIVGAKIVQRICQRLKLSNEDANKIIILVKNHMFYYNVNEVTESSVRRLIVKVGEENLKDLIDLRIADRLGSGVPKARPYKLRHLEYMIKKVKKDPISVKMLKINGNILMSLLNLKPGPKIGAILDVLLSEVIENPKLNNKEYLIERSQILNNLDLDQLRKKAKEKIEEKKMEDDQEIKREFWIK